MNPMDDEDINELDVESLEVMYNEIVRINEEMIQLSNFRINKANNIIIFDGAIIAVLLLSPLQFLAMGNAKLCLILYLIPAIFFIISLIQSIKLVRAQNIITMNAKVIVDKYWNEPKEVLLSQFSSNLSSYIYFNYTMSDFNDDIDQVNDSIYKDTLNSSLKFINYGVLSLFIVSIFVYLIYLS